MRYSILGIFACLLSVIDGNIAGAEQKSPVIIDTDCGTDDLMAISYILAEKTLDLRAITVVNGLAHAEQGAKNILNLLEMAGRRNIPVYVGESRPMAGTAAFPDEWRRLSDTLPGVQLPQSERTPERETAVDFLAKELRVPPGGPSLRILALGPLTNLARAMEASPGRVRGIRAIVIMGGALAVPGNLGDGGVFKTGNTTAEWNMYIDPTAARRVFASGLPIALVPLDATNRVPIDSAFVRDFTGKAKTPLSRFISQLFVGEKDFIDQHAFYAWDPLAAVILAHPGVAEFKDLCVQIAMKPPLDGATRGCRNQPPNVRVAMNANAAAFMRLFTAAFLPRTGPKTK